MSKKKSIEDRLDAIEAKLNDTNQTTHILAIQDKSGSMWSRQKETISGYNEYLEDLQSDKADEAFLTQVQFNRNYYVIEEETPIQDAEPLNESTYSPSGGTALLDAVGRAITTLRRTLSKDERAFVIIMTDGEENSSSEYTRADIKSLIKSCEREGNWTFTFLGAGQDSWAGGDMLGLRRNQQVHYGGNAHNHTLAFAGLTATTRGYRGGQSASVMDAGAEVSNLMAKDGAEVELETSGDTNEAKSNKKLSSKSGEKSSK